MTTLLKHFAHDKEVFDALTNPETLKEVLYVFQELTDAYMEETRQKINDPRRSVQQKAQEVLDIATLIIEAEKRIRELELYNSIKLKERGMNIIIDA